MHAPPLPALEYVPGAHASGAEVTEEEHLDPAGHVVHVSVAPFEYVPFPHVSWAVAPMGAFARWPGATVVQPVTYFVLCSAIGEISQSTDRKIITLAVLTARECSIWTQCTLRRAGFRVRPCSACNAILTIWARVPCRAGLAAGRVILAGAARCSLRQHTDGELFVREEATAAEVGLSSEERDGRVARRGNCGGREGE